MIVTGIITKTVAAAVIGILTFHSGRNIIQTQQLISNTERRQHDQQQLVPTVKSASQTAAINSKRQLSANLNDIIALKRSETLQIYLDQCYIPHSLTYIDGEWNGILLPNNGLVRFNRKDTNLSKLSVLLSNSAFTLIFWFWKYITFAFIIYLQCNV
jgi:hypothetical protein